MSLANELVGQSIDQRGEKGRKDDPFEILNMIKNAKERGGLEELAIVQAGYEGRMAVTHRGARLVVVVDPESRKITKVYPNSNN